MSNYLSWSKQTITNFSDDSINRMYDRGFLFTREGKGQIYETRSVRVNLSKFELSSENRRVLRKTENIKMEVTAIPYSDYSWQIGKMGKDFYETKFGKGTFSANKIKELMTSNGSNFNRLLTYTSATPPRPAFMAGAAPSWKEGDVSHLPLTKGEREGVAGVVGYCICLETNEILHYCYPFYSLLLTPYSLGMNMMTRAIVWAKEQGKQFVYLGSAKDNAALYKTQFLGFEWWDGKIWRDDIEELKNVLK